MTAPRRPWVVIPPAPPEFLAAFPEIPSIIAHLCYHRGIRTQKEVDAFLNPDYGDDLHDPALFRDMAKAVDRVMVARDRSERVLVHGDYDADGVSGATILADTLEAIGCAVDTYLPHRERDGYGFNANALAYARESTTSLVITCDCGIANATTIRAAQDAGMDVIVTDHHLIPTDPATGVPVLPPAHAILHPKVAGETYPYDELTGGGVAFKFCQAILARDRTSASPRCPEGFEKWLLDCVAISTVADYGRLIGENRVLVRYGLIVLQKTRRPGLRALYEVAGIRPEKITPATIAFQIAPRINAAGRIDHANEALKLLRARDPREARALAERLNATNAERQQLVEVASEEAIAQIGDVGDRCLLVVSGDWQPGIVGLVATRVREQYNRPTLAIGRTEDGKLIGSGRSIPGLHIVDALRVAASSFTAFGGHPMACGFTLTGPEQIPIIAEQLDAYARTMLTPEQLLPTLSIDWEFRIDDISWSIVEILERLGPFGVGNPTPRYLARGVTVETMTHMGNGGKHLKLWVRQNSRESAVVSREAVERSLLTPHVSRLTPHKLICFRYEDICPELRVGDVVDVVFEVDVNEWNGNREIQLKVVDLRSTSKS